jgi:dCMP deaminase
MDSDSNIDQHTDLQYRDLLRYAYGVAATGSVDRSTQTAALLVDNSNNILVAEVNCFTDGLVPTEEMHQRPLKYTYMEHSERQAIYTAAKRGIRTSGLTMVAPWASCADCARAIVQSGIVRIIRHADAQAKSPERWKESLRVADEILAAGGVEIVEVEGHLGAPSIMFCEERWNP